MPSHVHAVRARTVSRSGSFTAGYLATKQSISMGMVHIGYIETIHNVGSRHPLDITYVCTDPDGKVVARFEGHGHWRNARAALRDHALESIQ